jgi:sugar-specific transcriptional regulator TrmB
MGEELVQKLMSFGLSLNHAKVYASIINSRCTSVSQIAENTRIHPQDIYKIMKKLQQKGLIGITFQKPLTFEVPPIKEALDQLITLEKVQATEKIKHLNKEAKRIEKITNNKGHVERDEAYFLFLKGGTMQNHTKGGRVRVNLAFEDITKEYDLIWPSGPFHWIDYLEEEFKKLKRRKVKIRLLVLKNKSKVELGTEFKKIVPPQTDAEIREVKKEENIAYAILDFKELWIGAGKADNTLVTSCPRIVSMAQREFELLWNSPTAKTILKTEPIQKKSIKIVKPNFSKPPVQDKGKTSVSSETRP